MRSSRSDAAGRSEPASYAWVQALQTDGPDREEAIARLHELLLRAARFEGARRRATVGYLGAAEIEDLAVQSADDALVAVLGKLDRFAGRSRFTTWAYKFALLEMSVKLRRRPWQGRELALDIEEWRLEDTSASPSAQTEMNEMLAAVRTAIGQELTPHQREVLLAVAVNGVPIDVLAERLGTTRGALYKTVHDARAKLRRRLQADGHTLSGNESETRDDQRQS